MKNILLCIIAVILGGCSSSKIMSSWKAVSAPNVEIKKIMVVGLIHEKDRSLRHQMEDHITDDLRRLGYDAVSSLKLYGPKSFENMDEKQVLKKLRGDSIDAVLSIVLLNKEKERHYIPGHFYYTPYAYYYNHYYPYTMAIYSRIYEEGYYETTTNYFWESNLYSINSNNQHLMYSVQTGSFDPASTASMAHEYGRMIVEDMVNEGILKSSERRSNFKNMSSYD